MDNLIFTFSHILLQIKFHILKDQQLQVNIKVTIVCHLVTFYSYMVTDKKAAKSVTGYR